MMHEFSKPLMRCDDRQVNIFIEIARLALGVTHNDHFHGLV